MQCKHRFSLVFSLILCFVGLATSPRNLAAQYFGQNKVRYETADFKVLKTPHFDIYYYEEEGAIMDDVGRMAERWYSRLSRIFDHELPPHQPVILYASQSAFRATTILPEEIGEGTGGVTEATRRRVILPVAGPLADTDHVLGHELVHAFQYDITSGPDLPAAAGLPLWFIEGMAEYLSLGSEDPLTSMWVRDAVLREDLPSLKKLDDPRYFPYRFGQAFWAYVGGTYGDETIVRVLRSAARNGVDRAISIVLGIPPQTLIDQWHEALRQKYAPILRATAPPDSAAEPVIPASKRGSELNVGPVLSPDGSRMMLFSQRDPFSVDLYLADAQSGRIIRKVAGTATNPHFDSLQFISSAGGWSPDGKFFAFGAISSGRPELTIYDVDKDRVEHRQRFPELGDILSLTWSPDQRRIALSAMSHGVTDLFMLDVQSESLKQLTNDAFADLQPAWSPDGNSIAFATDRFTSDVKELAFGSYRLALIDVMSGAIAPLRAFDEGKHINPEWSADGKSIYFVSDRDGIANVYRLSLEDGALSQLTNTQTGVSGITPLSPAMSSAAKADRMVFTSFASGNYSIYELSSPARLAGTPLSTNLATLDVAGLPPTGASRKVVSFLMDPRGGLESSEGFSAERYKPHLSLDYVAPAEVSVGVSSFGSLLGGGTALSWSDMLGHHSLTTVFQTYFDSSNGGFVNNFAAVAGYMNQKSRWNWGFTGGQIPFASGAFSESIVNTSTGPTLVDQSIQLWQRNRELDAIFAYPFSRVQRVEFSTGYRNISYDAKARTQTFDLNTGNLISDTTEDVPTFGSLNLGTASAALVYDSSIFGGVSPVLGQRYRFEMGAAGGSLSYFDFLADYRKYVRIARPLVLAGRVMHVGRYGRDAEDPRLQDYFMGGSSLVRGYTSGSFSADECRTAATTPGSTSCPVFDQLIGSKVAIANAELRVPLLGVLGTIPSPNVPPVETALFYDAGVAWTSVDKASFLGGSRRPVSSFGGSLRVNILGFTVAQISYVHPNDRPAKNWIWEFSLGSGF